ncbi:SDR family oxidoreductase [Herbaspirillum sp. RV1423]|uniref:SDR family oxidoreductase n=1 Tax=Herbaspirillum sp. RV1423 TaxID=1443993 RepID=UPI0004B10FDF|nr:SDR family oxidoreductase [Herbaspirillum sp. RV1423]
MKAIVTGHSRGLGAAIAAELLGRGIAVLGLSRQQNPILQREFPALLTQHEIDLADTARLAAWLNGPALEQFCRHEHDMAIALINNAGTVQPLGALASLAPIAVGQAVALNVAAPLMLAAAVAAMDAQERRILHVSSGTGRDAYAGWSIYCATKAALDHHARAAALDGSSGLRLCSVAPGVIDTDMQAELRATQEEVFPLREQFHELKRQGHLLSSPTAAARIVDFLLSDGFGAVPVAAFS